MTILTRWISPEKSYFRDTGQSPKMGSKSPICPVSCPAVLHEVKRDPGTGTCVLLRLGAPWDRDGTDRDVRDAGKCRESDSLQDKVPWERSEPRKSVLQADFVL